VKYIVNLIFIIDSRE